MRTKLLLSLFAVSTGLSAISLVVIRGTLERQVRNTLSSDLEHSVRTFQNLQSQRRAELGREAALLADLPNLKALMTTSDQSTIEDGGERFWRVSGADILALANRSGVVVAVYGAGEKLSLPGSAGPLGEMLAQQSGPHLVVIGGRLFEVAFQPLYFGVAASNDILGYVAIGYTIDDRVAREVSDTAAADVVFAASGSIVSSTLNSEQRLAAAHSGLLAGPLPVDTDVLLGREHYLAAYLPLGATPQGEVRLVVLKSYDAASRFVARLNRTLAVVGFCVLIAGSLLAVYLAQTITRPLERLAAAAAALGSGDFEFEHLQRGAKEILELDGAFRAMRDRLRQTRQELLEAEQLATIGRMSSSISHDLRHSLSAVYASAEFLESLTLGPAERAELLADIRSAVQGMTELIDSLLLFTRTGQSLQLSREWPGALVENAIAQVRKHPDAQLVQIDFADHSTGCPEGVLIDARKMKRAIFNLLLNASQAAGQSAEAPRVTVTLFEKGDDLGISIQDNGPGVPAAIRARLFEPFVSFGKQNGIGLGLALALRVAQEHHGKVVFRDSRPGATIFEIVLPLRNPAVGASAAIPTEVGKEPA